MQLRFRSRFKTDIEFLTVTDNLLDHRAHLVNLYRVNYEILTFVTILLGGKFETVGYFFDTVVENIGETEQHRRGYILHLQFVKNRTQINRGHPLLRGYCNVTLVINRKILASPAVYVIQLGAILYSPSSHFSDYVAIFIVSFRN
jgi:hypothetical protein